MPDKLNTVISVRIPRALLAEVKKHARPRLISVSDYVRAALMEKLRRENDK